MLGHHNSRIKLSSYMYVFRSFKSSFSLGNGLSTIYPLLFPNSMLPLLFSLHEVLIYPFHLWFCISSCLLGLLTIYILLFFFVFKFETYDLRMVLSMLLLYVNNWKNWLKRRLLMDFQGLHALAYSNFL